MITSAAPSMPATELIGRVLGRAHRTMEDLNDPTAARAVLHVAQSFADELATLEPDFDRLQFIKGITDDPS